MTRNDARLIAEELIPLMRKEVKRIVESVLEKEAQKEDEFVGFDEASKITKLSIRYLREHIKVVLLLVVLLPLQKRRLLSMLY